MDKDEHAWSRDMTMQEWETYKATIERLSLPNKATIPENGSNIAQEATELVCGDRNDSYGHPELDYSGTARAWSGLLIDKLKPGVEITAREAILMMVVLKCRREVTKPKEDNRIDAIGYLLCADWVVTGNKPTPLSKQ